MPACHGIKLRPYVSLARALKQMPLRDANNHSRGEILRDRTEHNSKWAQAATRVVSSPNARTVAQSQVQPDD